MKKCAIRILSIACVLVALLVLVPQADAAGDSLEEVIIEAFEDEVDRVDIKRYGLNAEQLQRLFYELLYSGKLPWYAQSYSYNFIRDTGLVTYFWPNCLPKENYDRNLYERKVAEVLDQTVHPGMSHWQIALSIHDYLVAHCEYDESLTLRNHYDMLINGIGVCEAYAELYMDLMNRAGVPTRYVVSDDMNHAWNLVQIGGNWYHVDCTWDDPTSNVEGRVMHDYFLLSDKAISDKNHNHYGWETDLVCSDRSFDKDCFWLDSDSQIIYTDADNCYVRYREKTTYKIHHRDSISGQHTQFRKFKGGYINIGAGDYHYYNHGLSVWNNKLYFSNMKSVWSMNLDGTGEQVIYKYDSKSNKKCIRGTYVEDGILYITLRDKKGNQFSEQVILGTNPHQHSYSSQTIPASCYRDGYTTYWCSCGIRYESDHQPQLEHQYSRQVISYPTRSKTGLAVYTCDLCGHSYTETLYYRR